MGYILTNGNVKIGMYHFSDRKRPSLCVQEENRIRICGSFVSEESGEFFMKSLATLLGIKMITEGGRNE